MINLQRSADRRYIKTGSQEMWMSFDQENVQDPFHRGFRALGLLNEVRLSPGAEFKQPSDGDQESVTYVREGSLVVRHKPRRDEFIGPGCCQRAGTRRSPAHGAQVGSPSGGAHLFVSSMTSNPQEAEFAFERKHYSFSDRRGILRLIASREGRAASLRLQHDVRIYSSLLDPGHHVVHELSVGRGAWLHVVAGRVQLVDHTLQAGDGASVDNELALSFTALDPSEILLFDLA